MHSIFGWLPHAASASPGVWGDVTNFVSQLPDNAAYQFYFFRFMLGFFEGGFFPTVIVYLSYWFRAQDRAKAIACFMVAIPFSGAVGIPLSGVLLKLSFLEPHGWRWIFILQGIAPVIAGFATMFFLPDRPQDARWLPEEERSPLLAELDREHRSKQGHGHWAWVHHVGTVALLTLVYFGLNVSSYGLSMFMPAIIKSQTGATDFGATLISGVYYSIAALAMLFNGWHSDHTHERIWHVCIPLAVQGIAIFAAATFDNVSGVAVCDCDGVCERQPLRPPAGVLAHSYDVLRGHRGGLGHRFHQHGRQPRRLFRTELGRQSGHRRYQLAESTRGERSPQQRISCRPTRPTR